MRETRLHSGYHQTRQYCDFLDQKSGECTIYEYRPLACRTFFAFDSPDLCDTDNGEYPHAIFSAKTHGLIQSIQQQLFAMGGSRHADIREWFKETTEDPYEAEISSAFTFNYV
jgi:Fe-S-cluster containining protein